MEKSSVENNYTIIHNVNIIDVINGKLIPNKNLIIKDSIIHSLTDEFTVTDFNDAQLIDGTGKYIMPGLWDMHFHMCWEETNDSLLFNLLLSYGITGIRDMGGDLQIQKQFKEIVKTNPTLGPTIHGAGPIIDGNPPVFYDFTIPIDQNTDINTLLDSLSSNGSEFIKTYSLLRQSELESISKFSQAKNIPFAGHLSEYIDPETSIKLGQKSIEHLNRLDEIWLSDPKRIDSIAQLIQENDSWLCPTLIIYYLKTHMQDSSIIMEEYNANIHPMLMQEWVASRENRINKNQKIDSMELKKTFDSQISLLAHLHNKGVNILAGSDFAGMPFVYPGIGLHQELALLHQAGLTNAEVLATATINPAKYLSMEKSHGSISEGKIADLVLLDENPLDSIENTKSVNMVFRKGKMVENLLSTLQQKN